MNDELGVFCMNSQNLTMTTSLRDAAMNELGVFCMNSQNLTMTTSLREAAMNELGVFCMNGQNLTMTTYVSPRCCSCLQSPNPQCILFFYWSILWVTVNQQPPVHHEG
jgi:hypothetical protein